MIKNLAIGSKGVRLQLVLGLALGLLAAVLIAVYLNQAGKETSPSGSQTQAVVVASTDIPANTRVTADMLSLKALPSSVLLPGVFTKPDQVVGQVTQVPILAGEQVIQSKVTSSTVALSEFGDNAPLSLLVPPGKRAFSVRVSPVAASGGLIRPGDYVDVVLSGAAAGVENGQAFLARGSACYVVQDVEVLAVDSNIKKATAEGAQGVAASGSKTDAVSATLSVTPDQAWWLAAAQQSVDDKKVGVQLWLALRPFGEHGQLENIPNCGVIPGQ